MPDRPHRPPLWRLLLSLLVGLPILFLGSTGRAAELDDASWKEARKTARKLMREPGKRYGKQKVIQTLGTDNSQRAAALLVTWTLRSLKMQQGPVREALDEAKERFDKVKRIMSKAYDKLPPTRLEDKKAWDRVKNAYDEALEHHRTEDGVRFALGEAFAALRDPEAVTYLIDTGLPSVQKAKQSEEAQVAIARCLAQQPKARVLPVMLAMTADTKRVKLRMLALHWFGQHKHVEGFDALVGALTAKEVAVRRIAVSGLQRLDDVRAVEPLIDALGKTDGLLHAEIDDVLHFFTGKSFEGSPTVWKRWWKNEGAAWRAAASTERHKRSVEALPGGTRVRFYGIPTASHHVVFVLDRSGSMKAEAGAASIAKKGEKPKGPVTGEGDKQGRKGADGDTIAGDTRIEVAKNQLARSIEQLDAKVKFNVVFYSNEINVWKEPPELLASSRSNKKAAVAWFRALEAAGPTLMFPALMKALEYADTVGEDKKKNRQGADTIFLLSDGSPTNASGGLPTPDELEQSIQEFLEANKLHRCIVHCIGIGPGHNSTILRRLAAATGGQYKSVGAR